MCRFSVSRCLQGMAVAWLFSSQTGLAIDPRGIHIEQHWSVVGVIADGESKGIAVIKDMESDKTYTVKTGDQLPENPDFQIKAVRRKQVILSDGNQEVTIDYQTPEKDAYGEGEQVSRYGESYFNGFTTVPIEYYQRRKSGPTGGSGFESMPFTIRKVGMDFDSPEYNLYRKEQAYGTQYTENGGYGEDPAASDVTVNYDNFAPDSPHEYDVDGGDESANYRRRLRTQTPRWETVPKRALDESYGDNEEDAYGESESYEQGSENDQTYEAETIEQPDSWSSDQADWGAE